MDIKREPRRSRTKWIALGGGVLGVVAITLALTRLGVAAPALDRTSIVTGVVHRGVLTLDVHAPGTLVPEHVRIVAAVTAGRVEALPLTAGAPVTAGMTIVRLSNPDVELQAMQSEQQRSAAMSALASLTTSLRQQRLSQEGFVADMESQHQEALRNVSVFDALGKQRLASPNEVANTRDKATSLRVRLNAERQRLGEMTRSESEQVTLMREQVMKLRDIVESQKRRVNSMNVAAGESGQLQVLPLELGQWVNPGMELARIAQPGRLKALLRVPESQAKDIALGQRATIDTRNGVVAGHVMRADPSSQNGSVTVEVALDGPLPPGTRSDLSVDGTIEIARLTDVLYVARPAYGTPESSVGLFRLDADGKGASRVSVRLGRASASEVQVISGLVAGEKVIISDVANVDNASYVRVR